MKKIALIAIIFLLILVFGCSSKPTKVVIKGLEEKTNLSKQLINQTSTEISRSTVLFLIKNGQSLSNTSSLILELKDIAIANKGISLKINPEEKKIDLIKLNQDNTTKLISMSKIAEGDYDELRFNFNRAILIKNSDEFIILPGEQITIPIKLAIDPKENYVILFEYFLQDSLKEVNNDLLLESKIKLTIYKGGYMMIDSNKIVDMKNPQEIFTTQIS